MIEVLIIEDEDGAADALEHHVHEYCRCHGLDFSIARRPSAFDLLQAAERADLVFLDIDLPGMSGMDAAQLLRVYNPVVPLIFVTNLGQYAVRGYEVDALGFIVKPISYPNFALYMDKAVRTIERNRHRTFRVETHDETRVLSVGELVYVDVHDHNVTYHLDSGECLVSKRGSLKVAEKQLDDEVLMRISSGCIVNVSKVVAVRTREGIIRVTTGETLEISRSRRHEVLARIADHLGGTR